MSRRAERRRTLICCALELDGPATLPNLARALRRPRFLVWNDLTVLEEAGAIVAEWQPRDGWPTGVWTYWLPTPAEQAAAATRRRTTEERLRAALRALAEHAVPDDTTTREGNP